MPDDYRCTITCAFCVRPNHYKDECYHKQRLPAKLTNAKSQNGGQNGKGNGKKGKRRPKGCGKGQDQGKAGRGGPNKKNKKNQQKSRGHPSPMKVVTNPQLSGGLQNCGPKTRAEAQAQAHQEHGDQSDPCQRARCKKGFDITLLPDFTKGRFRGSTDLVFSVRIRPEGRENLAVVDAGAAISILAMKILPRGDVKNIMPTAVIRMQDRHVVHSCRD